MSGLRRELAGAGLLLFMMGPAAGRGQTVRRVRARRAPGRREYPAQAVKSARTDGPPPLAGTGAGGQAVRI